MEGEDLCVQKFCSTDFPLPGLKILRNYQTSSCICVEAYSTRIERKYCVNLGYVQIIVLQKPTLVPQ